MMLFNFQGSLLAAFLRCPNIISFYKGFVNTFLKILRNFSKNAKNHKNAFYYEKDMDISHNYSRGESNPHRF